LLRTIFTELITNALKYSKKGKTRFGMINCKGKCIFYVKDSGIGIRAENLTDIFDSFIKITEYSSTLTRGTGIGLSMVKKMVKKLGAEIKVKSVFKKGTVFYFEIPCTE
jgi:signal transduction histidine kinase